MDIGYALFKGFLQGLTEFLPVSSTAHLIFTDAVLRLFGTHEIHPVEEEFFDIVLHMGTLIAVVWYFRDDLKQLLSKVPQSVGVPGVNSRTLPLFLGLSMTVTVVFILSMLKGTGYGFQVMGWVTPTVENLSDFYLQTPALVAVHLLITGCLLFFTEKFSPKVTGPLTPVRAAAMGLAQGFAAIFHGISRSGSTISTGLALGLDRATATRYSFLLSIPTFLAAMVYEALKIAEHGGVSNLNWPAMLLGMAVSGVVGYLCVKYFILFVARHTLTGFAIYCWVMGALMLTLFATGIFH